MIKSDVNTFVQMLNSTTYSGLSLPNNTHWLIFKQRARQRNKLIEPGSKRSHFRFGRAKVSHPQQQGEVVIHHHRHQLLETHLWTPAQSLDGEKGGAGFAGPLLGPHELGVDADVLAPVKTHVTEGHSHKVLD